MKQEVDGTTRKTQILILGGGFAGVETARYLDRTAAKHSDVEVILVSRDNFTLFTSMLDEVAARDLEPTHICNPLRKLRYSDKRERIGWLDAEEHLNHQP